MTDEAVLDVVLRMDKKWHHDGNNGWYFFQTPSGLNVYLKNELVLTRGALYQPACLVLVIKEPRVSNWDHSEVRNKLAKLRKQAFEQCYSREIEEIKREDREEIIRELMGWDS